MAACRHETEVNRKANASIGYLREYFGLPTPVLVEVLCGDGIVRNESVVDETRTAQLGDKFTSMFMSSMVARDFDPNNPESVSVAGFMTVIQTERVLGISRGLN